MTEPESGRSSPVMTISSVDLPEPDGPSSATASPLTICRPMSRRIWTRAAPRPSDRLTPLSAMASPLRSAEVSPEMSFMLLSGQPSGVPAQARTHIIACARFPQPAHMGLRRARPPYGDCAQRSIRGRCSLSYCALRRRARAGGEREAACQDCRARRFADGGIRPARERRLRAAAASGAGRQRHRRRGRKCRRVRRYRVRWACAARLVGAAGHRCRHRRARRQRHAARHQAGGDARCARRDPAAG